VNFSSVILNYYGSISSILSIGLFSFWTQSAWKLSSSLPILETYSIKISSPVITIFCFLPSSLSLGFEVEFEFDIIYEFEILETSAGSSGSAGTETGG
jgi:hypothetical protein